MPLTTELPSPSMGHEPAFRSFTASCTQASKQGRVTSSVDNDGDQNQYPERIATDDRWKQLILTNRQLHGTGVRKDLIVAPMRVATGWGRQASSLTGNLNLLFMREF